MEPYLCSSFCLVGTDKQVASKPDRVNVTCCLLGNQLLLQGTEASCHIWGGLSCCLASTLNREGPLLVKGGPSGIACVKVDVSSASSAPRSKNI